jgi:hypothetical protein
MDIFHRSPRKHPSSAWATRHRGSDRELRTNCCSLLLQVLRVQIANECRK